MKKIMVSKCRHLGLVVIRKTSYIYSRTMDSSLAGLSIKMILVNKCCIPIEPAFDDVIR